MQSEAEQHERTLFGSDTRDVKDTKEPKYAEHGDGEDASITNKTPKPFPGSPFAETISIHVGPSNHNFIVHKDVICKRSTYFNSRCSGRWGDVGESPLALEDVDPAAFNRYVHVLYHNKAHSIRDASGMASTSFASNPDSDIEKQPAWNEDFIRIDDLVRTYIVADRLGDLISANIIIDQITNDSCMSKCIAHPKTATYVFHNTVKTAPLRKLMVHFYVKELREEDVKSMTEGLPKKFYRQVLRELRRLLHQSLKNDDVAYIVERAADIHPCHWHQHDDRVLRCSGYDSEDTGE